MKRFLGVWCDDPDNLRIAVEDSAEVALARQQGRTSPLLPALKDGPPASLPSQGVLLFLIAPRPSAALAMIMNDLREDIPPRVYISHGHAAIVLLLQDEAETTYVVESLGDLVSGYEYWPFSENTVHLDDITSVQPESEGNWSSIGTTGHVETVGLSYEAAAQVNQFNANLAIFSQIASRYAPELLPLVEWMAESIRDIAQQLTAAALPDADDSTITGAIGLESLLVEANAVLTLYCSQVGSGTLPLNSARFPVGEYSLLGIGGMARAAWRIYSHLNETFAQFDHSGRIERNFSILPPFDPFGPSGRVDYGPWRESRSTISQTRNEANGEFRYHMPYFSSRWGFHESVYSISLSWQCLYASASKEWNLLTITHEFLHAHVRDLMAQILEPREGALEEDIVRRFNAKDSGRNALESMQVAYVEGLAGLRAGTRLASMIAGGNNEARSVPLSASLTTAELRGLVRAHKVLFDEIVVHILDFLYTYDGRDEEYLNSIWSSWSLVPSVNTRIEYYVLRTLCALAATSPYEDASQVFEDVTARCLEQLRPLLSRPRVRPAISRAISLLESDIDRRRLGIQFKGAQYVVQLALQFLVDPPLHAALVRDAITTVQGDVRTYAIETGDYRGEWVESPIGFLLDRFSGYADQAGTVEVEYESVWQMLQLI